MTCFCWTRTGIAEHQTDSAAVHCLPQKAAYQWSGVSSCGLWLQGCYVERVLDMAGGRDGGMGWVVWEQYLWRWHRWWESNNKTENKHNVPAHTRLTSTALISLSNDILSIFRSFCLLYTATAVRFACHTRFCTHKKNKPHCNSKALHDLPSVRTNNMYAKYLLRPVSLAYHLHTITDCQTLTKWHTHTHADR